MAKNKKRRKQNALAKKDNDRDKIQNTQETSVEIAEDEIKNFYHFWKGVEIGVEGKKRMKPDDLEKLTHKNDLNEKVIIEYMYTSL